MKKIILTEPKNGRYTEKKYFHKNLGDFFVGVEKDKYGYQGQCYGSDKWTFSIIRSNYPTLKELENALNAGLSKFI